jgi:hypothetical protein
VHPEADQPEGRDHRETQHNARRHFDAFTLAGRCEHEKWQRQPGRDLYPHARDQRPGGRAQARALPGY